MTTYFALFRTALKVIALSAVSYGCMSLDGYRAGSTTKVSSGGMSAGGASTSNSTGGNWGSTNGGTGGGATGGSSTVSQCTNNNDCISQHNDQAYICRSGTCVQLMSANCPVLIPALTALGLLGTVIWRRARVLAGVCCLLGLVAAGALSALQRFRARRNHPRRLGQLLKRDLLLLEPLPIGLAAGQLLLDLVV